MIRKIESIQGVFMMANVILSKIKYYLSSLDSIP